MWWDSSFSQARCWGGWCAAFCARSDGSRSCFTKSLQKSSAPGGYRILTYLKYGILALFVIVLPMTVVNEVGMGDPFFCKYICPAASWRAASRWRWPMRASGPAWADYLPGRAASCWGQLCWRCFLPAFLQVAVPAGGLLRAVQQNFHLPPAGGLGPVHRLRGVQSCVQDGCGCVQDAQPC